MIQVLSTNQPGVKRIQEVFPRRTEVRWVVISLPPLVMTAALLIWFASDYLTSYKDCLNYYAARG